MNRKIVSIAIVLVLLTFGFSVGLAEKTDFSDTEIRISVQYGMQYAPVYVMVNLGLLEELMPGVKVSVVNLTGGSVTNEALISGQIDIGFMGIPPAVIAWSKGVDYKIFTGTCVPPSDVMVRADSGLTSLADFTEDLKIAVPSIGSIQHIMLAAAAKKQFGDAHMLDSIIMPMANPDAFIALLNNAGIVAHMASMPYLDKETQEGFVSILSGRDAFGMASIVGVCTKDFHNNYPEAFVKLNEALSIAVEKIVAMDEDAVQVISEVEKITPEKAKEYIEWPGTYYSTDVYGAMELASLMYEFGYITKEPATPLDIMWDNVVVK